MVDDALLSLRGLRLSMQSFDGKAKVLNGVDLTVRRGEIWGLVGESGCGKSLTGLSITRLLPSPPALYEGGEIVFAGRDLMKATTAELEALRGKRIGMIFQDPTTNLNPVFTVGVQLVDVALAAARHDPSILDCEPGAGARARRKAAWRLSGRMLERVGIKDAADRLNDYPHQFSGGMRQRVLIAMALVGRPELLIADEPTTALDVSVQAQILALIKDAVRERRMGVVLTTHNLGVVAQTCTHVAVMYAGNIVESGPVEGVIGNPAHPYTQALLAAIPTRDTPKGSLRGLPGQVPNLTDPPPGCRFATRCPLAIPPCQAVLPPAVEVGASHRAACIRVREAELAHV